jgi:5-formyltetrahydrofolate cyclo-ligase
VREASRIIQQRLIQRPEFRAAGAVSCYLAQPREVQTRDIVEAGWSADKRLAVPAFRKKAGRYGFAWLDRDTATREGPLGILEPAEPRWVEPGELDLLVVPCVAFDGCGRRLGHGGGYFDRLLARHSGLKVCLAFEGQRMTVVPVEPQDIGVDLILTEQGTWDARGRQR